MPYVSTSTEHSRSIYSNETVGVIFKIEPEAFRILDQTGAVRTLRPSQVGNKLDTRMSVATDKDNYELRSGDMVREAPVGVSVPDTVRSALQRY